MFDVYSHNKIYIYLRQSAANMRFCDLLQNAEFVMEKVDISLDMQVA